MDGWQGMLLDDIPNWEHTSKTPWDDVLLGMHSLTQALDSHWDGWGWFFAFINVHTGRYNVFKAYTLISTPLGKWERVSTFQCPTDSIWNPVIPLEWHWNLPEWHRNDWNPQEWHRNLSQETHK